MATAAPPKSAVDRKLTLKEVLDWLVEDGLVEKEVASKIIQDSRYVRGGAKHPFVIIAEANIRSPVQRNNNVNPEGLTVWLAARMHIPFAHVDPLKIDLKSVTQ